MWISVLENNVVIFFCIYKTTYLYIRTVKEGQDLTHIFNQK